VVLGLTTRVRSPLLCFSPEPFFPSFPSTTNNNITKRTLVDHQQQQQ
jgi:hypothetical protein